MQLIETDFSSFMVQYACHESATFWSKKTQKRISEEEAWKQVKRYKPVKHDFVRIEYEEDVYVVPNHYITTEILIRQAPSEDGKFRYDAAQLPRSEIEIMWKSLRASFEHLPEEVPYREV